MQSYVAGVCGKRAARSGGLLTSVLSWKGLMLDEVCLHWLFRARAATCPAPKSGTGLALNTKASAPAAGTSPCRVRHPSQHLTFQVQTQEKIGIKQ